MGECKKMNLNERIQVERNRVSGEIEQLKKQNEIDQGNLNELKQEYHAVVVTGDDVEIDKVNAQIKEVSSRVSRRNDMIKALEDKNNPVIQKMISMAIEGWLEDIQTFEGQATEKLKKLEKVHQTLVKELLEVNDLYRKSSNRRSAINQYTQVLNSVAKKKLGISNNMDIVGPIPNKMRSFLIESHQVFKR